MTAPSTVRLMLTGPGLSPLARAADAWHQLARVLVEEQQEHASGGHRFEGERDDAIEDLGHAARAGQHARGVGQQLQQAVRAGRRGVLLHRTPPQPGLSHDRGPGARLGGALGQRDPFLGLLHRQANLSEGQDIAVHHLGGLDRHAVAVRVQAAADVGDAARRLIDLEHGMAPGDAAVMQDQIVPRRTPDRRRARPEHVPVRLAGVVVDEGEHGSVLSHQF